MAFCTVKNSNVYYQQIGNKESDKSIVLVHGAMGCAEQMQPIAEQLKEYNCIIFDLPAHLRSTGNPIESIEEYADFMENFLLTLKDEGIINDDLIVIGGSMGGSIVIELLTRKLAIIKKAAIISSAAKWDFNEFIDELLESFKNKDAKLELLAGPCATPLTPKEILEGMLQFNEAVASYDVAFNDFNAIKNFDKIDELHTIDIPCLIISGDGDGIAKTHCSLTLYDEIPESYLAVYPNRGHALCFEKATEVCQEIRDFLTQY